MRFDRDIKFRGDPAPIAARDCVEASAPQVDHISAHRVQLGDGNTGEDALANLSLQSDRGGGAT